MGSTSSSGCSSEVPRRRCPGPRDRLAALTPLILARPAIWAAKSTTAASDPLEAARESVPARLPGEFLQRRLDLGDPRRVELPGGLLEHGDEVLDLGRSDRAADVA